MSGQPSESNALSFEQIFTEERLIQKHPIDKFTLDNLQKIIKKDDNERLLFFLFRLYKSGNDELSKDPISLYKVLKDIEPKIIFSEEIKELVNKINNPKDSSNAQESKKKLYRLLIEESYKHALWD